MARHSKRDKKSRLQSDPDQEYLRKLEQQEADERAALDASLEEEGFHDAILAEATMRANASECPESGSVYFSDTLAEAPYGYDAAKLLRAMRDCDFPHLTDDMLLLMEALVESGYRPRGAKMVLGRILGWQTVRDIRVNAERFWTPRS